MARQRGGRIQPRRRRRRRRVQQPRLTAQQYAALMRHLMQEHEDRELMNHYGMAHEMAQEIPGLWEELPNNQYRFNVNPVQHGGQQWMDNILAHGLPPMD